MKQNLNVVGYHTPEKTQEVLTELKSKAKHKFEDSSWKNDLTDSVWNEEHDIYLYVPNSELNNSEEEQWNTYTIIINHMRGEGDEIISEHKTIEEVIIYINNL